MITKAFILGAGLGTRLRPMTDVLPKPLVPLFHRPLVTYALDHCIAAGITSFAINTHHLHDAWAEAFPDGSYKGCPITFFHEPILLETGGGIKNIEQWIDGDPILIYNGDIHTDINLEELIHSHVSSANIATLALRADGPAKHLAINNNQVIDIHRKLDRADGTHQFTGIYCINAEILKLIPHKEKISIIPTFLQLAERNELGAHILNGGMWLDIGTQQAFLEAHLENSLDTKIHPSSKIDPTADIDNLSVIGPGCHVGAHSKIRASVMWPNTSTAAHSSLDHCICFSHTPVQGNHSHSTL